MFLHRLLRLSHFSSCLTSLPYSILSSTRSNRLLTNRITIFPALVHATTANVPRNKLPTKLKIAISIFSSFMVIHRMILWLQESFLHNRRCFLRGGKEKEYAMRQRRYFTQAQKRSFLLSRRSGFPLASCTMVDRVYRHKPIVISFQGVYPLFGVNPLCCSHSSHNKVCIFRGKYKREEPLH